MSVRRLPFLRAWPALLLSLVAKNDPRLYEGLPAGERTRDLLVGLTLLVTAGFAGTAAFFTARTLTQDQPGGWWLAAAFAICWGFAMLVLDAGIVTSLSTMRSHRLAIVLRVLIAVAVAVPHGSLVVQSLLAPHLGHEITLMRQEQVRLQASAARADHDVDGLSARLASLGNQRLALAQQAGQDSPAVRAARHEAQACVDERRHAREQIQSLVTRAAAENDERRARIAELLKSAELPEVGPRVARLRGEIAMSQRPVNEARARWEAIEQRCTTRSRALDEALAQQRAERQEAAATLAQDERAARRRAEEAESKARAQAAESEAAIRSSYRQDLVSTGTALWRLVRKEPAAAILWAWLTVLCVLVESLPVCLKLASRHSASDRVHAAFVEERVAQVEARSAQAVAAAHEIATSAQTLQGLLHSDSEAAHRLAQAQLQGRLRIAPWRAEQEALQAWVLACQETADALERLRRKNPQQASQIDAAVRASFGADPLTAGA